MPVSGRRVQANLRQFPAVVALVIVTPGAYRIGEQADLAGWFSAQTRTSTDLPARLLMTDPNIE
jgi:hypothetical protein